MSLSVTISGFVRLAPGALFALIGDTQKDGSTCCMLGRSTCWREILYSVCTAMGWEVTFLFYMISKVKILGKDCIHLI